MEQFSAALKELDEQLTCSVCLNHYTSPETVSPSRPPKTLPCLHTFCLQCIEKLPKQLQVHAVTHTHTQNREDSLINEAIVL